MQPVPRRVKPFPGILRMLPLALLAFAGCNVEKIDAHLQGPTRLSGRNAALGGVHFTAPGSDADHHIAACRGAVSNGIRTIRLGESSGSLPLTLTQAADSTVAASFAGPRGAVRFDQASCHPLALKFNSTELDPASVPDGEAVFNCQAGDQSIVGTARFQQCTE